MSEIVIEAKGLTKRYGRVRAVESLDLTVRAGEVFGLLGPNGAGKTTTILMLLGLTEPTAGSVTVLGHDPLREPLQVKRLVGYLPDAVGFYDQLTARENLAYMARLAGIGRSERGERINRALTFVRLDGAADRAVKGFSRGMRQRLGIADLLVKNCRIAILDEPTSGLDPQSTQELLEMIGSLSREGMTILLSSHLLSLVQSTCHRVALFSAGRVGLTGTVAEVAAKVLGGSFRLEGEAQGVDLSTILSGLPALVRIEQQPNGTARVDATHDLRAEVAQRVVAGGGRLLRLEQGRLSLDEVYRRYFEQVDHAKAA